MTPIKKYRCDQCLDLHEYEEAALECCPNEISEVYVCPACGDDYRTSEDAHECCDLGGEELPPTAAELEAAGQLRIF